MQQTSLHPMLNVAIKAARAAGAIINRASLDLEALRINTKSPNDFVTEVDHAAEGVIIETLLGSKNQLHNNYQDFQAFLDNKPIGHHRFTLNAQGDARELKSETRFVVKLLFITAYRYTHDAVEHWRGDCLERLRAQNTRVEGQRAREQLVQHDAQGE